MSKLDPQQVEIVGKHVLIANLIAAGIEVAEPIRDRGIDLIAFVEGKNGGTFNACPIQLKASTNQVFGLDRKYENSHSLRIVFVWEATVPKDSELYSLTYEEAERILHIMEYDLTDSWEKGRYVSTKPSRKLKELLKAHRVNEPKEWLAKLGFGKP